MRLRPLLSCAVLSLAALLQSGSTGLSPCAAEDTEALLVELEGEQNRTRRIDLVRRLGRVSTARGATALADIVRQDADAAVRIEAATALAGAASASATSRLCELAAEGGVESVRAAVRGALAGRGGALLALGRQREAAGGDPLAGPLLVAALAHVVGRESRLELEALCRAPEPWVRSAALRALAERADCVALLPSLCDAVLSQDHDPDTVWTALDLALRFDAEGLAVIAPRLDGLVAEGFVRPVAAVRARIAGESTPDLGRVDRVYCVQCAGDGRPLLRWMEKDMAEFARTNAGGRVGLVVYRAPDAKAKDLEAEWTTRAFPLTHDHERARRWLAATPLGGADAAGAPVDAGLRDALDRMPWRSGARRECTLVPAGPVARARAAEGRIRLHVTADAVTVRVLLRADSPGAEGLAHAAGVETETLPVTR